MLVSTELFFGIIALRYVYFVVHYLLYVNHDLMPVEPRKPAQNTGGHSELLKGSGTALNHFFKMYFLISFLM